MYHPVSTRSDARLVQEICQDPPDEAALDVLAGQHRRPQSGRCQMLAEGFLSDSARMIHGRRSVSALLLIVIAGAGGLAAQDVPEADDATARGDGDGATSSLRDLDAGPYRTPRAGEGFRTTIFGREVVVEPRDRRSVSALDLGFATTPRADENEFLPFGSVYLWRHPDDTTLFRAAVVGVYNEVFYAKSPSPVRPLELVLTFENYTIPVIQGELIDGKILDDEKIFWGYVRPGMGLGYRRQIDPGADDNMFAVDLTFEPGFIYFGRDHNTSRDFQEPDDAFEGRVHLQLRYDALERNLLELPHTGFAFGSDLVYGFRTPWGSWGTPGTDRFWDAGSGRDFISYTGYLLGVYPVPFVASERHRLIGAVYGGVGDGLDRFSAPRVGGGPDPRGEEYGSVWRPSLPGAAIGEFFPDHYVMGGLSYRWEATFFTHLSAGGFVGYLDRDRRRSNFRIERQDDFFSAVGGRVTTGFLGETRIQIGYNYNFDVFRGRDRGGHEVYAHVSKDF